MISRDNPSFVEKGVDGKTLIHGKGGKPVKLPQTANLPGFGPKAEAPRQGGTGPFLQTQSLSDEGKLAPMTDAAYVIENATAADLAELRRRVEKRIEAMPLYRYFKCPECGWREKVLVRTLHPPFRLLGRAEAVTCASCNPGWRQSHDPGKAIMQEMTAKEAAKYEADVAEKFAQAAERLRADEARFKDIREFELRKQAGKD